MAAHRTRILTLSNGKYFGNCSCGWRSDATADKAQATAIANDHVWATSVTTPSSRAK